MNDMQDDIYSIPFTIRSSYKLNMHILYVSLSVVFSLPLLIPSTEWPVILYKIFCLALIILFMGSWLYVGVLKKSTITLNNESIILKTLFGSKAINWSDIAEVNTYNQNRYSYIGIITNKKLNKRKNNFLHYLWEMIGGLYTLSIPRQTFPKANWGKLYATIDYMVQNVRA